MCLLKTLEPLQSSRKGTVAYDTGWLVRKPNNRQRTLKLSAERREKKNPREIEEMNGQRQRRPKLVFIPHYYLPLPLPQQLTCKTIATTPLASPPVCPTSVRSRFDLPLPPWNRLQAKNFNFSEKPTCNTFCDQGRPRYADLPHPPSHCTMLLRNSAFSDRCRLVLAAIDYQRGTSRGTGDRLLLRDREPPLPLPLPLLQ